MRGGQLRLGDAQRAHRERTRLRELPRLHVDLQQVLERVVDVRAVRAAELLAQLESHTGARFVLIPTTNSLFGPTTTTAGLLVGADIRRALDGRHDIDLALIPAECINDNGVFLDDEPFITLREQLAMPVYPSYDFIDVLVHEGEPRVAEVAA